MAVSVSRVLVVLAQLALTAMLAATDVSAGAFAVPQSAHPTVLPEAGHRHAALHVGARKPPDCNRQYSYWDTPCGCLGANRALMRPNTIRLSPEARRYVQWRLFLDALPTFLVCEAIFALVWFVGAWLLGLGVVGRGWNPSYTRKVLAIALLATPVATQQLFPVAQTPFIVLGGFLTGLACLALFAEPLRRRSHFMMTAFMAFDRPEDRPFTLRWLISSYVVSSMILFAMMWGLPDAQSGFVLVAIAATGIGDTLAGVVGVRFGRHRYRTSALFTSQTYTRSLEGSACVFLVTAIALYLVQDIIGSPLWPVMLVLPALVTLAEAKSPHTWDEPVMTAACGLVAAASALLFNVSRLFCTF